MRVAGLYIYPIKALGAVSLPEAEVTARGLSHKGVADRQFMLVDANNKFITQREYAQLATLRCTLDGAAIIVTAPDGTSTRVDAADAAGDFITVSIWKDAASAQVMPQANSDFFSTFLGKPVRLVYMGAGERVRGDNPTVGQSFADGHPMLTCTTGSLVDLNSRLDVPVPMERFRANIVIENNEAWAEDSWKTLQAGAVQLHMAKPCPRCVVTTIDQQSGIKASADPLQTLVKFRFSREFQGALFGQDTVALVLGTLRVGDDVTVTETQAAPEFMVRAS